MAFECSRLISSSAKDAINVEQAFMTIAKNALKQDVDQSDLCVAPPVRAYVYRLHQISARGHQGREPREPAPEAGGGLRLLRAGAGTLYTPHHTTKAPSAI